MTSKPLSEWQLDCQTSEARPRLVMHDVMSPAPNCNVITPFIHWLYWLNKLLAALNMWLRDVVNVKMAEQGGERVRRKSTRVKEMKIGIKKWSWRDHDKDGGGTSVVMEKGNVRKSEHTDFIFSISFFLTLVIPFICLLFSSQLYFFSQSLLASLPSIFFPFHLPQTNINFNVLLFFVFFSNSDRKDWEKLHAMIWENEWEEEEWETQKIISITICSGPLMKFWMSWNSHVHDQCFNSQKSLHTVYAQMCCKNLPSCPHSTNYLTYLWKHFFPVYLTVETKSTFKNPAWVVSTLFLISFDSWDWTRIGFPSSWG